MASPWNYKAKVVRVVDGDTFDAMVDLGFKIYHKVRFRLLDVDTPERGEKDWSKATGMLGSLLAAAEDSDGEVVVVSTKTGKYGRWLAFVDGVNEVMAAKWPYPKKK